MCQQLTKRACRRTVVTKWKCDCCGEVWIDLALKLQLCGLRRPTPSLIAVLKCPQRFPYGGREGVRVWTDFQWCSKEMMLSACMEKAMASQVDMQPHALYTRAHRMSWIKAQQSCHLLITSIFLLHHFINTWFFTSKPPFAASQNNSMKHWKQCRPTKLCVLSRIT